MLKLSAILILTVAFLNAAALAQNNQNVRTGADSNQSSNAFENIAQEVVKISKSVEALNQKLKNFSETFSSNQGLRLTERQQKLLVAFEFLNRADQRLETLQKLKIELTEKQTSLKVKLSKIEEDSRPEGINRSVAAYGTTNAEEIREIRRQVLYKQKNETNVLLEEIQNTLSDTNAEIRQTEMFLKNIRQRIFPQIEKELSDL